MPRSARRARAQGGPPPSPPRPGRRSTARAWHYSSGPRMSDDVLALFDLDHTLLTLDSDEAWVEFLIEEGTLERTAFERANHDLVSRYRAGEATSVEFTHFYLSTLVGQEPSTLAKWHAAYLERKIRPAISEAARALLARHRSDGHLMI